MSLYIEIDREEDGRWIGEVQDLPGLFAYGDTRGEAIDRVKALALRIIADRLERGERIPDLADLFSVAHAPLTGKPTPLDAPEKLHQE
jgi:predicted RNase H-like HicB family nuclease